MGTQGTGRKRIPNRERLTAEDDALNQIAREAEARLAAKRAARAEAREIRMKELERQQKEIYQVQKKYYGLDNKWGDIEQWMEDSEKYSHRPRRNTSISDDDERMSVGSRGSLRSDLDSVGVYAGAGSHKKKKKKKHSKASSGISDESRASKSSRYEQQMGNYCSSDLFSSSSLSSSKLQSSAQNGTRPSMLCSDAPPYRSHRGSVYEDSVYSTARRFSASSSRPPSEYSGFLGSNSRASSRASSARASPVCANDGGSVAGFLRSAASSSVLGDLDDVTIPDLPDVEERSDKDFLEKGTRTASTLSAATLASLGGISSRRGSGDTSVSADTEASIREIKDSLAEVEEKYRKAMVSNAQLDNEKSNLMYQVDTLKDSLMELEEQLSESRREYEEKAKDYERERHAHSVLQFQFNEMKETLRQSEELLTEIRQLHLKQDGYVREISDLQETLEWKDKKIGALERQKEYSDAIRNERDELRDEVVVLKDVLKKHGIVLGPDLPANGDVGDGVNDADSSTRSAQDSIRTSHSTGDGLLGRVKEVQKENKHVEDVGNKEILEKAENNTEGQQEEAESEEGSGGEKMQGIQGADKLSSPAPCGDLLNNLEEQSHTASIPTPENAEKTQSHLPLGSDEDTRDSVTDQHDTDNDITKVMPEPLGVSLVCDSTGDANLVAEREGKRDAVTEMGNAEVQVTITAPEEEGTGEQRSSSEGDESSEERVVSSETGGQTGDSVDAKGEESKALSLDSGGDGSSSAEADETSTGTEEKAEGKRAADIETKIQAPSEIVGESPELSFGENCTENETQDLENEGLVSGVESVESKDSTGDGSGQVEETVSVSESAKLIIDAVKEDGQESDSEGEEETDSQDTDSMKSVEENVEPVRDSTVLSARREGSEQESQDLAVGQPEDGCCDREASGSEEKVAEVLSDQEGRVQEPKLVSTEAEVEGESALSVVIVTPALLLIQNDPESRDESEDVSSERPHGSSEAQCPDDPGRETVERTAKVSEGESEVKAKEGDQDLEAETEGKPEEAKSNEEDNIIQEADAEEMEEDKKVDGSLTAVGVEKEKIPDTVHKHEEEHEGQSETECEVKEPRDQQEDEKAQMSTAVPEEENPTGDQREKKEPVERSELKTDERDIFEDCLQSIVIKAVLKGEDEKNASDTSPQEETQVCEDASEPQLENAVLKNEPELDPQDNPDTNTHPDKLDTAPEEGAYTSDVPEEVLMETGVTKSSVEAEKEESDQKPLGVPEHASKGMPEETSENADMQLAERTEVEESEVGAKTEAQVEGDGLAADESVITMEEQWPAEETEEHQRDTGEKTEALIKEQLEDMPKEDVKDGKSSFEEKEVQISEVSEEIMLSEVAGVQQMVSDGSQDVPSDGTSDQEPVTVLDEPAAPDSNKDKGSEGQSPEHQAQTEVQEGTVTVVDEPAAPDSNKDKGSEGQSPEHQTQTEVQEGTVTVVDEPAAPDSNNDKGSEGQSPEHQAQTEVQEGTVTVVEEPAAPDSNKDKGSEDLNPEHQAQTEIQEGPVTVVDEPAAPDSNNDKGSEGQSPEHQAQTEVQEGPVTVVDEPAAPDSNNDKGSEGQSPEHQAQTEVQEGTVTVVDEPAAPDSNNDKGSEGQSPEHQAQTEVQEGTVTVKSQEKDKAGDSTEMQVAAQTDVKTVDDASEKEQEHSREEKDEPPIQPKNEKETADKEEEDEEEEEDGDSFEFDDESGQDFEASMEVLPENQTKEGQTAATATTAEQSVKEGEANLEANSVSQDKTSEHAESNTTDAQEPSETQKQEPEQKNGEEESSPVEQAEHVKGLEGSEQEQSESNQGDSRVEEGKEASREVEESESQGEGSESPGVREESKESTPEGSEDLGKADSGKGSKKAKGKGKEECRVS
ncbi:dentin sialophosphoprotein isoform X6 [Amia ocellicauda]|uniref:dentin sialophosphoprotein isoform X6 n=1 Tax=Amia ocellicauda TaxID=2972642 RepID=UPI003464600B